MQEKQKNSLRKFQCRDHLWEIFEQMSVEQNCSTDYLVNEAIRQFAISYHDDLKPLTTPSSESDKPATEDSSEIAKVNKHISTQSVPPPIPTNRTSSQIRHKSSIQAKGEGIQTPPPPTPSLKKPSIHASGPSTQPPHGGASHSSNPPQLRTSSSVAPPEHSTLFVIVNGEKIPVKKQNFIIGRHSKRADLVIRDGNVSRQHCCVVFDGGNYFIKDLGSRNGIEHMGSRVDSIQLNEGSVINLCQHSLQFTFQ